MKWEISSPGYPIIEQHWVAFTKHLQQNTVHFSDQLSAIYSKKDKGIQEDLMPELMTCYPGIWFINLHYFIP
ncbi:hypothetical protein IX84_25135 [Phaeodactylibacter xiamenensis]|uniref:Uncharacterized protein n=1 Tax=Phaeodactylibacter xiamenensis TaxID=1524460 RepID=A0A098S1A9_9BACT|nr:hypothetical protein IX84_25135 [Phaeodactylibacter xiamenensis]